MSGDGGVYIRGMVGGPCVVRSDAKESAVLAKGQESVMVRGLEGSGGVCSGSWRCADGKTVFDEVLCAISGAELPKTEHCESAWQEASGSLHPPERRQRVSRVGRRHRGRESGMLRGLEESVRFCSGEASAVEVCRPPPADNRLR